MSVSPSHFVSSWFYNAFGFAHSSQFFHRNDHVLLSVHFVCCCLRDCVFGYSSCTSLCLVVALPFAMHSLLYAAHSLRFRFIKTKTNKINIITKYRHIHIYNLLLAHEALFAIIVDTETKLRTRHSKEK